MNTHSYTTLFLFIKQTNLRAMTLGALPALLVLNFEPVIANFL
jgi:hypothetical protein